ncbi:Beta-galactosidase C-terminal domain [Tepidibacillus decaturensis]|uniref:Beta-galactosidase C-terminal domain-containing protein n=1 Tax=Tepidibacillus decaturensis TaxID=1413211 RepID=A0A135L538_9BACI|nr:Beta-galactosidase C-terminal domain [Tepidibacillus decaturensis]KXG44050.1 hypothetical protein U473_08540 [Tepidibacillus decaturensis]
MMESEEGKFDFSLAYKEIIDCHGIDYIHSDKDVEVYKRESQGSTYLFVLNHSSETKTISGKKLPPFASIIVKN